MLHNNEVSLILEWDTEVDQECISRLTHNHSAEELSTEPCSTTWRDGGFNDGDLEIRTSLAEHVGSAQTAGSGTDDDDIRLGVSVEVLEIATSHGAGDLRFADGSKCEALLPFVGHFFEGLGLVSVAIESNWLHIESALDWNTVEGSMGLDEHVCG
jgi:hypothetical protein